MSNRVVHFEIPADDPQVNMQFFGEVFGWKFVPAGEGDYWLAISGDESTPGINGAMMKKIGPGQPVINTIQVADIDAALLKIAASGGKVLKPKREILNTGWLAFFADPEGNVHGVMEMMG